MKPKGVGAMVESERQVRLCSVLLLHRQSPRPVYLETLLGRQ